MSFYFSTYIERDLRSLINVKELSTFENFMKLCVARTGQIVNYSNLASDCGVSHNTIKHWLSILEASYVIKLLQPYYKNINKRVIKAPKLYFLDTGLACFLMGIHDAKQLEAHPLRGALFETLVMTEILKSRCNQALVNGLYFYRDHAGNEIDLVLDRGSALDLIEIKMGKTIHSDFFKGIHYYQKNSAQKTKAYLVYGGEAQHVQEQVQILGWKKVGTVF
jgi:predicted AAA+ superfamily ATPase